MKLTDSTILIADDNADDRFFMRPTLDQASVGNSVHFSVSGNDAIAYLHSRGKDADRGQLPSPFLSSPISTWPMGTASHSFSNSNERPPVTSFG